VTLADALARPGAVRCRHRPVVALADGRCPGYQTTARLARSCVPFAAAADCGLSGTLGALALEAALLARSTLPGDRFLSVALDAHALAHPAVSALLEREDDVSRLVLDLTDPPGAGGFAPGAPPHPATEVLAALRGRGLRVSAAAGGAGLGELVALRRLGPDLVRLPAELVRSVEADPVRRALIGVLRDLTGPAGLLAEEVETLAEVATLRDLGVELAAGWLFGRARPTFEPPPDEACAWLRTLPLPRAEGPEGDGGRGGDVERVDAARHRDPDRQISLLDGGAGQAVTLRPEDEGQPRRRVRG
jgi:EAL domain-containing protein (putative c-di-GMP-specific phosphodiesterase class I)